jgi:hypothetical protein
MTRAQKKQVIDFVRQKSFRRESTILNFICNKFEDVSDSAYELAQLVEHGPLEWFGADEEKYGPDKAGEMQLMYRYNPRKKKPNEALRNARN